MAGVKPVEYINDSTTAGFAVAGDSIEITEQNAATIEKDDKNGNLETLDNTQIKYLDKFTENDKTDYDNAEGDENLDSVDSETQEENKKGNGSSAAAGAATAGTMGALAFGAAILTNTGNLQNIMNAFTAPVVGGVDVAAAAAGLAGVLAFDKDYSKRLSEASAAGEQINAINQYYETLNQDLEALNGTDDNTTYEIASEEGTEETAAEEGESQDIIAILSQLYTQLDKANADNDQAKANEISGKISQIETSILAKIEESETAEETPAAATTEGSEGAEGAEGAGTAAGATEAPAEPAEKAESLFEHLATNNSAAHEAFDTASNVSSFLKEGNNIGSIGIMNTAALAGCAAISGVLAARAFTGVTIFTIAQASIGAALCGAAAGVFTGAAATMGVKAANELKAGSKGNDVYSAVTNLRQPLNAHDSIVEKLQGEQKETSAETTATTEGETTSGVAEAAAIAGGITSTPASTGSVSSTGGGTSSASSSGGTASA